MSSTNPATVPVDSPAATNTWLAGLNWGSYWDTPASTTAVIYYYVADNEDIRFGNLNSLTDYDLVNAKTPIAAELAAVDLAMQVFENVADISFVATTDIAQADIVWAFSDFYPAGSYGVAVPPGDYYDNVIGDYQGGVVVNSSAYEGDAAGSGLVQGGYDFITLIHELGHALGMAHPHDTGGASTIFPGVYSAFGSYGTYGMNQGVFTTMSYNDGWRTGLGANGSDTYGWQGTPMALDVAWLQAVYGANANFNSTDTVYELGDNGIDPTMLSCIWDTGGTDWLTYDGAYGCTIDIRAATLETALGGGGYVSYVQGAPGSSLDQWKAFTIAAGVVIENASGGSGADRITGNSSDNILSGGAGKDRLTGGAGSDTFVFDTALNKKTNVDAIIDFAVGTDTFQLDDSVFASLSLGALSAAELVIGKKALDGDDHILYNAKTGALSYDADGAGGAAAVQFALLTRNLILTSDDFDVV